MDELLHCSSCSSSAIVLPKFSECTAEAGLTGTDANTFPFSLYFSMICTKVTDRNYKCLKMATVLTVYSLFLKAQLGPELVLALMPWISLFWVKLCCRALEWGCMHNCISTFKKSLYNIIQYFNLQKRDKVHNRGL